MAIFAGKTFWSHLVLSIPRLVFHLFLPICGSPISFQLILFCVFMFAKTVSVVCYHRTLTDSHNLGRKHHEVKKPELRVMNYGCGFAINLL